ncbi:LLM class flavin-dependent oxidoreductase [Ilumatobacter sp.]|uniref:LLM class flavin-dependent oxidoreductase n=1 Tax=Ilumatobacter sp. TaxID=1967498 RepID=UPI003C63FA90
MKFGICVASRPADLDYVVEAERLGFSHAWMADSQMIWSDVYAMLALAAERTSTIQLGTGVAVAGTRLAPVTAASIATINQLAPGRTFCGIGTGNTAMRIMGHPPLQIAEFDEYLAALRPLLRGEETDFRWRDRTARIVHQMPDHGFVNFDPPPPLYVSAFGPRALDLAAQHGDGLITSAPPDPVAVRALRGAVTERRREHGHAEDRASFPIASLTTIAVLQPGEPVDSPRIKEMVGAFAIAALHYAYEQYAQFGRGPSPHLRDIWDEYVAAVESVPEERRHLRTHLGHNCWVIPEEERFLTAQLIERSCLVGTPSELRSRVDALEAAGLDQLVVLPPLATKEEVIADVARVLIDRTDGVPDPVALRS